MTSFSSKNQPQRQYDKVINAKRFLKLFEANQPAKFGEFMTFGLKVRKESVFCAPLIRVSKPI